MLPRCTYELAPWPHRGRPDISATRHALTSDILSNLGFAARASGFQRQASVPGRRNRRHLNRLSRSRPAISSFIERKAEKISISNQRNNAGKGRERKAVKHLRAQPCCAEIDCRCHRRPNVTKSMVFC